MNRMFRQRKYDTRRIDRQYAEETDVYVMLYNSYADALYAYGMGFGFDNETVKDVIHDIFLDIMTRQVDLGRIVNIKAYLFRIVHNRLVDLHRSRVDKCDLSDREPGLRVSLTSLDAMIESEHVLRIRQTIESLLNQLSPKQREALLLRYGCGYSTRETASLLGLSFAAAQKLLQRAKAALRTELEKEGISV